MNQYKSLPELTAVSSLALHPLISSFTSEIALYTLLLLSSIMFELWKTTMDSSRNPEDHPQVCDPFKRPMTPDFDEGVERSMARRRKDAPPMNINAKCRSCDKVFRRPCDLTKHEKTHSRPWKCTERSCKYFELGWPTEKERDRHINDKHSRAPVMYKCLFAPCTYQSKRESNCKQHMEKSHGWAYVRSKNNGRGSSTRGSSAQLTPNSAHTTPATPSLPTPGLTTPFSSDGVEYYTPLTNTADFSEPMMSMGQEDFQLFSDPNLFNAPMAGFSPFGPLPGAFPEMEQFCAPAPAPNDGMPEAFSMGLNGGQGDLMLYTPASPWPDDGLL